MKKAATTIQARRLSKAFTIVELLIVIVIIAILVGITVVGYGAVTRSAQDSALKADLQKLGDAIKLQTLDDQTVPSGGATSIPVGGDSTVLPGVSVKPDQSAYNLKVTNLFYCAGNINGSKEFAFAAQSKSGKSFTFKSNKGIETATVFNGSGTDTCAALGFTAPYTWSYGFNPADQYRWFAWANGDAPIIKNIALNPQGIGTTNWFDSFTGNVPVTTGVTYGGKTGWYRYVWSGTGATTVRMNVNLADLTNGKTYTASIQVANSGSTPVSFTMDWNDSIVEPFTLAAGESKRVYTTASRATYDSTFRFFDFNLTTSGGAGLLVREAMVTEGDADYLYRDGTSVGWSWSGTANASTSSGPGQLNQ